MADLADYLMWWITFFHQIGLPAGLGFGMGILLPLMTAGGLIVGVMGLLMGDD